MGIDVMDVETYKRQRGITQLMFESVPQVIIQSFIFFKVSGFDLNLGTNRDDLTFSLIIAACNILKELGRCSLEAKGLEEHWMQHTMSAMSGMVGWVPYMRRLELRLHINPDGSNNEVGALDRLQHKARLCQAESKMTKKFWVCQTCAIPDAVVCNVCKKCCHAGHKLVLAEAAAVHANPSRDLQLKKSWTLHKINTVSLLETFADADDNGLLMRTQSAQVPSGVSSQAGTKQKIAADLNVQCGA